jgi:hypothetical protein
VRSHPSTPRRGLVISRCYWRSLLSLGLASALLVGMVMRDVDAAPLCNRRDFDRLLVFEHICPRNLPAHLLGELSGNRSENERKFSLGTQYVVVAPVGVRNVSAVHLQTPADVRCPRSAVVLDDKAKFVVLVSQSFNEQVGTLRKANRITLTGEGFVRGETARRSDEHQSPIRPDRRPVVFVLAGVMALVLGFAFAYRFQFIRDRPDTAFIFLACYGLGLLALIRGLY